MASREKIHVYTPLITAADKKAIAATAQSGWVSSLSPVISQFEERVAEFTGVRHAVATMNGTTAIHLALAGIGEIFAAQELADRISAMLTKLIRSAEAEQPS